MNIYKKMATLLSPDLVKFLRQIGGIANGMGYRAFIVGGLVRDLLLGLKNLDLDIVIEGNAADVGKALACKMNGRITVYKRYGTCTVKDAKGFKVDLVTARKEFYKHPAALPQVAKGSLKDDLARRDFSINAMAVSINNNDFGLLIDLFGGVRDLERKSIEVLHDLSFYDDPTRIFRAIRFAERLGFKVTPRTERLMHNAVKKKIVQCLEPRRVHNEMMLIMKERMASRMTRRLKKVMAI